MHVKLLLAALRQWRQLGAALARRRPKGLTRLVRLILARPSAAPARVRRAPTLLGADTS